MYNPLFLGQSVSNFSHRNSTGRPLALFLSQNLYRQILPLRLVLCVKHPLTQTIGSFHNICGLYLIGAIVY